MNHKGIDNFLLGIAEATNALISLKLEQGLKITLNTLCDNLNITAAGVYINDLDANGKQISSLKFYKSNSPSIARVEHNQKIRFTQFNKLFKILSQGHSFEATYSESEGLLREHMKIDHTMSVALFPIMVRGQLWGALSLSDSEFERKWAISEKQETVLRWWH